VPNFIQVSIFILQNKHGQILLSLRDSQKELPNQWEFPGGKVERHEGPYQALLREAREELSIKIKSSEFLMQYFFSYKDLFVHLYVWLIKAALNFLRRGPVLLGRWRTCDDTELKAIEVDLLEPCEELLHGARHPRFLEVIFKHEIELPHEVVCR